MCKTIQHILLVLIALSFATLSMCQKAPDYTDLQFWAAHPDKEDASDKIPQADVLTLKDNQKVDVFFLHPTTYTKGKPKENWNADIMDEKLRTKTEEGTILHQASIFNGGGNVYAPFYRQAHLESYFTKDKARAKQAFDLAYDDVKAAYLVGMPVPKHSFHTIPACETPEQISCFCSWRTYKQGYKPKKRIFGDSIAVINPISWTISKEKIDKSRNKGSVLKDFDAGFILNLFYESVRNNSINRVKAYHKRHNKQ